MSAFEELQVAIREVADRVGPAVVGIGSHQRGSGVVVSGGAVVTNAHNLRGDEVTVTFADGRRARGRVAGVDVDGDLAVITVDTADVVPLAWAADADLTVGTAVFGVAATPAGRPRVTLGFVSALERAFRGPGGRRIGGGVEHTAPLAPGSSGGPIVDVDGRILGIDTNRLGDGFYLAVPADAALRTRVEALGRGEAPSRPRLGVAVAPSMVARRMRAAVGLPERDGVLVRAVEDDGPAARAGIREGDLIIAAAGRPIAEVDALHEILESTELPIELAILRGTEERTVSVGGGTVAGEA